MHRYHPIKAVPASAREQFGTIASLNGAAKPSPEAVRAQLDKILASRAFAGAERPGRFLRFIVEQALVGNQLKETLIGVEVFGRNPAYDPRLDGVGARGSCQTAVAPEGLLRNGGSRRPRPDRSAERRVSALLRSAARSAG